MLAAELFCFPTNFLGSLFKNFRYVLDGWYEILCSVRVEEWRGLPRWLICGPSLLFWDGSLLFRSGAFTAVVRFSISSVEALACTKVFGARNFFYLWVKFFKLIF